jgi:hypothetical protein
MRTLVVGLPLPHVSFDNYSFVSAPAFSEYARLIVQTDAVSKTVENIVASEGEHRTFAGQPITNGPSTAEAFSLLELLEMRRRETEWFLARGGVIALFAHPDVAHPSIAPTCGWRRYAWLPAPQGFRYDEHLLPGFGTPGADLIDPDHPFAPYITGLSNRIAYRATVDEQAPNFNEYARVFARSHGGAAIGVELTIAAGKVVLLPPLIDAGSDRSLIAQTLHACFERYEHRP